MHRKHLWKQPQCSLLHKLFLVCRCRKREWTDKQCFFSKGHIFRGHNNFVQLTLVNMKEHISNLKAYDSVAMAIAALLQTF